MTTLLLKAWLYWSDFRLNGDNRFLKVEDFFFTLYKTRDLSHRK